MRPTTLINRRGELVPFDRNRIAEAINRAQLAAGDDDPVLADELANVVLDHLERIGEGQSPHIERIQDAVLYVLRESGNYDVAMSYSRYRDARERSRRERLLGTDSQSSERVNLQIICRDGRNRPWSAAMLERNVERDFKLSAKAAKDIRREVEQHLLRSEASEIDAHLLSSLIETSLVRHGLTQHAIDHSALRVHKDYIDRLCDESENGQFMLDALGQSVLHSHSLLRILPAESRRLYMNGRLWVDGLSDPLRGSHFTTTIDGQSQVWQVVSQAFATATQHLKDWQKVTLILPPIVLGSLEQELEQAKAMSEEQREREHRSNSLVEALEKLADIAQVFLYCDGRTPLLDAWPFKHKGISLATYAQDFLILRRLQELDLKHISGPTLMKGGYRRRVGVALALNAQGLDDQFSQLDHIAMGLVAAAKARLEQLNRSNLAGADIRYAIYGLPPGSSSSEYLERQITQEGLRCGFALSRTSSLPAAACEHLSRLFDDQGD